MIASMKNAVQSVLVMLLVASLVHPGASAIAKAEGDRPDYGENGQSFVFVAPSGSDEAGDGTPSSPWKTPGRAASAASPGDTIRLGAGTYEIDTPVELPPGVSLEGAGESTVLTSSTLTEEMGGQYALLRLVSPAAGGAGTMTDGCQHVSHLWFDGAGKATQAIEVQNRSYVSIHDCTIIGFVHVGVGWRVTDMGDGAPAAFAVGGLFCNNTLKDNSFYGPDAWGSVYGRGALFCGGLQDFEISGNTIIEDCRTGVNGMRGVPVKFWYYNGWMVGCRIHDNRIWRLGSPTFSTDEASWAFAIESSYHAGMEISHNDFIGAVDLNNGRCGTYGGTDYAYATWMHDNRFSPDPTPKEAHGNAVYEETAIILEARTERTVIERNHIRGYNQALYFNVREGVWDFAFRNNLCEQLGGDTGSMFRMDGHGSEMQVVRFSVADNLFESSPSAMSGFGIIISQEMGSWSGQDIRITGNAVGHTAWNWLVLDDYTAIDGLTVRDNLRFNTGGEYLIRSGETVSNYVYADNEAADPERWAARQEEIQSQLVLE